jgi:hypothetical protein
MASDKESIPVYNVFVKTRKHKTRRLSMKYSKSDVQSKVHALPELKFENQTLTSFAGLVIFQKFFATIALRKKLRGCFAHLNKRKIFDRTTLFMQLIVHLLLGFRELKDCRYYRDDPLVKRLLGLKRIPDVATLSRFLKEATAQSTNHLRRCLREKFSLLQSHLGKIHTANG